MTTTTPGKRGPYARSQKRREKIAETVLSIVDELGHDKVTTALVAERSDTNEATLLYHFPTKDHLIVAALERVDAEAFKRDVDPESLGLDMEGLRTLTSPTSRVERNRRRLYEVLKGQAASESHPASDYFTARTAQAIRVWTELIEHRQKAGLAHPDLDPRAVALQVFALWEGLSSMAMLDDNLDLGGLLADGIRRLTGQNWLEMLTVITAPQAGL